VSLEDFDYTFAVHVRGAMAHMNHVAARMRAQQQGSSITSVPSPGTAPVTQARWATQPPRPRRFT